MYKIHYWCDYSGDHRAKPSTLESTDIKSFGEVKDAIDFLNECTDPITKLDELVSLEKIKIKQLF